MTFPTDQPEHCVVGANPYTGLYFRFCTSNRRKPKDPKNHKIPLARFPDKISDCGNWALSGYLDQDALEAARQQILPDSPQAEKWPVMAYDLTPSEGLIRNTPAPVSQEHYDLWLYEGVDITQRMVDL